MSSVPAKHPRSWEADTYRAFKTKFSDHWGLLRIKYRVILKVIIKKSYTGFPYTSVDKKPACNAGNPGLIPGSGRSPGEGNGNSLQLLLFLPRNYHGQRIPGRLQSMLSKDLDKIYD